MKTVVNFFRLIHISFILLKHGLDEIVLKAHLFRPLRFLIWLSPIRWSKKRHRSRGTRIREALEELGPIFVKFGQVLSTRFDILPEDIVTELVRLQDQVPPFPGAIAQKIIENALERPLSQIFQNFELTPLASASIAQVHAAILLNGQNVVIKVLRPNIHKIIKRDINLLKKLAYLVHKYWKAASRFKPKEIIAEFEKTLLNELDLVREAANASQLKRNFHNSSLLYVPTIYWSLTRQNVLVMERIYGICIANSEALKQRGFDLKQLAQQIIKLFFTQVFRDCFFHADLHPGNILISDKDPKHPQYITVDFGIMGILSPDDQHYLAENFLAFLKRDYRRVALLHIESGWIPPTTRIDDFEASIRTVCEPMFERPLKEISFGTLLFRLFQTAIRYHINIQPQLMLLQKTLMNIEGLSRQLHPDIDLWESATPALETWMKNQRGIPAFIRKIKAYGPSWLEKLPDMPNLLHAALTRLAHTPHPYNIDPPHPIHPIAPSKRSTLFSFKDLCLGFLIGISVSLIWFIARRNI
jgi:ubiquinone biosynthesis protein